MRQSALKSGNHRSYNTYRNKVNRSRKSLRSKYYQRNINGLQKSNPRLWWQKTHRLIGRKADRSNLEVLSNTLCDGNINTLTHNINTYFHSVSANLSPLPPPTTNYNLPTTAQYIISIKEAR